MGERARRFASLYLLIQGLGAGAWWVMLWTRPEARRLFHHPDWPEETLMSLWLGDVTGFVGGSLVAAWLMSRGSHGTSAALWFVAGVSWFATAQCVVVTASSGGAWVATALMVPATAATSALAMKSSPDRSV